MSPRTTAPINLLPDAIGSREAISAAPLTASVALALMKIPAKRRNKFFLMSYGRYTPKLDPQLLNAATQAERNRIAALIELQEGPGRFL